ncbi:MAG: helix-turn-helix transcriptional regulator [Solobacterium sp.]|nr:helix-turn-helix transcriptional regulator [Solobacterium sp.]
MDIGRRIRQLRVQNGLTLEELASRTELTKGFLSQLERNLASPSIQTLEDIAEALGTTLAKFFAEEANEQIVFTGKDFFTDKQETQTIHWIVPNAQKNAMEPIILELQPKASSKTIVPHEGEEFGYVLSGRLYLCVDGDLKGKPVRKGDTFYLTADRSHYLENRSDKPAAVLWISTPPVF